MLANSYVVSLVNQSMFNIKVFAGYKTTIKRFVLMLDKGKPMSALVNLCCFLTLCGLDTG